MSLKERTPMRAPTRHPAPTRLVMPALCLVLALTRPPSGTAADAGRAAPARAQVLDVLVTYQICDEHLPWRLSRPQFRQGYGVVIGPGRILTTEDLVRLPTLVELRVPGSAAKFTASVLQADPQLDTALLTVADPGFQQLLEPVALASNVARGARTRIVQYDESGLPQQGEGRVVEIGVEALPAAPEGVLTLRVLSDLRVLNPGAPVYAGDQLAGLMMRYDILHQTGFVLPAPVLARFLRAAEAQPYVPPPSGGFDWATLVDPVKRRYLGVPETGGGIQVLRAFASSGAAAVLQASDVLLRWDGFDIDNQGFYSDPDYGRMGIEHAIGGRHRAGDKIAVDLVRQGQPLTVSLTLTSSRDADAFIPEGLAGAIPDYLVEGGFVLRELSGSCLRMGGGHGLAGANARLVHLYLTRANLADRAGDHVVILAGVLPDPVNIGYQELRDEVVTAVNGQPVRNLKDVFRIVEHDRGLARLSLQGLNVDVALDTSLRDEANSRIAKAYRIPELRRGAPAP